ncbi:DUF1441 family protein [Escherichia coli]|nr:DUF1441 family protein [Escherichia coli]
MDHELKNLVLNINQLAALSGLHRQTVVARLKNIRPAGGHDKLKLYRLTDILTEFMGLPPPVAEGEMDPHERKAWYQSERERLKFEQETAQLIPASDVRREFAIWAKAVVQVLETLTGYGSRGERWIIDRYNITQSLRGDSDGESQRIDPASYPEDWDVLLTDVFHKSWPLASDPSQQMRLMAMAVDSGGEDGVTDNAYKFWRRCRRDGLGKRIYLFKGDSIRRAKLITRTFPDNTGRTGRRAQAAGDVPLWLLQTDALKDRVNNALWRDSPGPGYVHFPDWLGSWFYDELTYEERSSDGKWSKPGRGANEAFDLMVYAEALVILHGYEKIRWPDAPEWASRETWLECVPDSTEPSPTPEPVSTPVKKQKRKKTVTDDVNPWLTSGGWL